MGSVDKFIDLFRGGAKAKILDAAAKCHIASTKKGLEYINRQGQAGALADSCLYLLEHMKPEARAEMLTNPTLSETGMKQLVFPGTGLRVPLVPEAYMQRQGALSASESQTIDDAIEEIKRVTATFKLRSNDAQVGNQLRNMLDTKPPVLSSYLQCGMPLTTLLNAKLPAAKGVHLSSLATAGQTDAALRSVLQAEISLAGMTFEEVKGAVRECRGAELTDMLNAGFSKQLVELDSMLDEGVQLSNKTLLQWVTDGMNLSGVALEKLLSNRGRLDGIHLNDWPKELPTPRNVGLNGLLNANVDISKMTFDELQETGVNLRLPLSKLLRAGAHLQGVPLSALLDAGVTLNGMSSAQLQASGLDLQGTTFAHWLDAGLNMSFAALAAKMELCGILLSRLVCEGGLTEKQHPAINFAGVSLNTLIDLPVNLQGAPLKKCIDAGLIGLADFSVTELHKLGFDMRGCTFADFDRAGVGLKRNLVTDLIKFGVLLVEAGGGGSCLADFKRRGVSLAGAKLTAIWGQRGFTKAKALGPDKPGFNAVELSQLVRLGVDVSDVSMADLRAHNVHPLDQGAMYEDRELRRLGVRL